jgi:hypothetical protein
VQLLRDPVCDSIANITYASVGRLLSGHVIPGVVSFVNKSKYHAFWPHVPLPDSCVLFARKFAPDVASVGPQFFGSCWNIGLSRMCLADTS